MSEITFHRARVFSLKPPEHPQRAMSSELPSANISQIIRPGDGPNQARLGTDGASMRYAPRHPSAKASSRHTSQEILCPIAAQKASKAPQSDRRSYTRSRQSRMSRSYRAQAIGKSYRFPATLVQEISLRTHHLPDSFGPRRSRL